MTSFKQIKSDIKKHKNGILAGLLTGLALTIYVLEKGTMVMAIDQPGWIDTVVTSLPASQLIFLKLAIVYMTVGAIVGYLIEEIFFMK